MGGLFIKDIYGDYSEASLLETHISYLPALNNIIHSLQRERGASQGYLGSQHSKNFGKILSEYRSNTDHNLLKIEKLYQTLKSAKYSPKAALIIQKFPDQVKSLHDIRQIVQIKGGDNDAVFSFYSALINSYIALIGDMSGFHISVDINNALGAYKHFMIWKEETGQERALGAAILDSKNFNALKLHNLIRQIAKVGLSKNLFMDEMSLTEEPDITAILNSPVSQKITEIEHALLAHTSDRAPNIISGIKWYQLLTVKIDVMIGVEKKLLAHLMLQTKNFKARKKAQMMTCLAIIISLFVAAIAFSLKISWSIAQPLYDIGQIMSILRKGREIPAALQNIPYLKENNEIGHLSREFSEMLITIHKQKKYLKKERDNAKRANNAKSDFLANMSHELRTPLNAVIGFSEILSLNKEKTVEENAPYIGYIHESGEQLLRLVDNILNMSQINAPGFSLKEDIISLQELVKSSFTQLKGQAEKKGVTLSNNLPDTPITLKVDQGKFDQAILHLLSNAIKFSKENAVVSLRAKITTKGCLVMVVQDKGIGMTKAEKEKSLQAFEQTEKGYSRNHDGIGLGLPLAQGIIKQHSGVLKLISIPNIGTTAVVRLPCNRVIS